MYWAMCHVSCVVVACRGMSWHVMSCRVMWCRTCVPAQLLLKHLGLWGPKGPKMARDKQLAL